MAVQTITYANKSYINQNAGVAATNKVQDTDMNEIKSVVNNNATILSGVKGFLLWTNPNPTSSMPTTTNITLSTSDYDLYEVIYAPGVSASYDMLMSTGTVKKGYGARLQFCYWANSTCMLRDRNISYVNDTTLTIGTNIGIDGDYPCRPMYIIGYKTGIFD